MTRGDVEQRVRLGANAATGQSMLLELARDPAVTVRAAVAINSAAGDAADGLLAADVDERVRTLLAEKLARRLPGNDAPASLDGAMMATLSRLVDDAAVRVRAAIAAVVKDLPEAPRALILRLAGDPAMAVCGPVIRLSPQLDAADLLALLERPGSAATATAVAHRPGLTAEACDVIAGGDDAAAIRALLCNPTAAIRETTLDGLVDRAAGQVPWHAPLVRRAPLSARAVRLLSEMVASHLLEELASRCDLDGEQAADLRRRLDASLLAVPLTDGFGGGAAVAPRPRSEPGLEEAMGEARHLWAEDRLDEAALLAAGQRGEVRLVTAMLAVAAELPVTVVERAATLRSAKGLVSLVWKAGFSMRAAVLAQGLLARIAPSAVLRAVGADGFPLAIEEMRWQIDFLGKMAK